MRTLPASLLLGSLVASMGVAVPHASAMDSQKVCISVSTTSHYAGQRQEGTTTYVYIYLEDHCDMWMDTSGGIDSTPPRDGGSTSGGKDVPMSREDECDARAAELQDMEDALRAANDNVAFYERVVAGYDTKETDAAREHTTAAAAEIAATDALEAAESAYARAHGPAGMIIRLIKGEEVEVVGEAYDISTPEGAAVVRAQSALRDAQRRLTAAQIADSLAHGNDATEAQHRAALDAIRNVLATYPQQIERLRAEYRDRC